MNRVTLLFVLLGLVVLPAGCGGDDSAPTPDKGPEEEELIEGKDDSFYHPTEHGQLTFGIASQARITDDERFHAWTFELTDVADIELVTSVSQNLDTVMYLYYREDPSSSWGPYIKKNDDYQGNIWSRIGIEGKAGHYRVIVKPFKKALRGPFTLESKCDGAGCVQPSDGTCDRDATVFDTGNETGFAPSCAGDVRNIISTPVTSSNGASIQLGERCDLIKPARMAAELYYSYWDDLMGWEDFVYDEGTMNISYSIHGDAGTTVGIDVGGDEDSLIFVFDHQDELVMYYHDEQSPMAFFFCQDDGEAGAEEPDYDCLIRGLYDTPHDKSDETSLNGETTHADADADLGPRGFYAIESFVKSEDIAADVTLEYSMTTWGEDNWGGAQVSISYDGAVVTYDVVQSYSYYYLTMRTDDAGTTYLCEEYNR